jgi:hypothetical protein
MNIFGTEHPHETRRTKYDGVRHVFNFTNGFGASVLCDEGSYGNENGEGLWELAVIGPNGFITTKTPITPQREVLGSLTAQQVGETLRQIEALPSDGTNS